MIVTYALPIIEDAISSTNREAKISSESEMWKKAMLEKMNSLHKKDTWKLSELPIEKVIGWKWVYDLKMELLFATKSDW